MLKQTTTKKPSPRVSVELKSLSSSETQGTGSGITRNEAETNQKRPCMSCHWYNFPVFEERVQPLYKNFEGYCQSQQLIKRSFLDEYSSVLYFRKITTEAERGLRQTDT